MTQFLLWRTKINKGFWFKILFSNSTDVAML